MPRRTSQPRKGQRASVEKGRFKKGQEVLVNGAAFGKEKPFTATVEADQRTMVYPDGSEHEKVDIAYTRTDTRGVWHSSVEPGEVTINPSGKQRTK